MAVQMSKVFFRSVLGVALSAALASPAFATHFFAQASVNDFDSPCGLLSNGGASSAPISAGAACPAAEAGAISTPGHVGVSAHVSGNGQINSTAVFGSEVTFVPLNGEEDSLIPMQLNLAFLGSMAVGGESAETGFDVTAEIESTEFFYSTSIDTSADPSHGVLSLPFTSGGEVVQKLSDKVGGVFRTPVIMVPVLTPIAFEFRLHISGFGNPGSLNDLFLNSLDLVSGQDVFTLPDGYTAEDPDAFIFDNRYLPPGGGVPEPASWALMIAGFGLTGAALRRRAATRLPRTSGGL
jgi:hypothetical protein